MAQLESSAADTRRRTLALEVLVDRLIGEVDQLRLAMGIIDLGSGSHFHGLLVRHGWVSKDEGSDWCHGACDVAVRAAHPNLQILIP